MKISPTVTLEDFEHPRVVWVVVPLDDVDAVCEVSSVGDLRFNFHDGFTSDYRVPMSAIEDREVLQYHLRAACDAHASHLAGAPRQPEPATVQ